MEGALSGCAVWVQRIHCLFQTTQPSIRTTINFDFICYILGPHYTKWRVSPGQALVVFFSFSKASRVDMETSGKKGIWDKT